VQRVSAVATAAMREAPHSEELVGRWEKSFGIAFRVISGAEEASLIARGVLASEKPPSGPYALIDIGGGSTELSLCQGDKVLESVSLPLGANRLQQACLKSVPPAPGGAEKLRQLCHASLQALPGERRWPRVKELIGSGGSIRAVRKLAKAAGVKDQPFTTHFLSDLVRQMLRMDRLSLLHIPGMDERRLDLVLAGALLLEACCHELGASRVRATEATLRDGLLQAELERFAA
jgi:exopolyphosphatase/guanosine-5'-triphosphate,3'-diphosphate pyrophosphatase